MTVKSAKNGRGRPRGFGDAPSEYKDRFQKFYYKHRKRLNDERRRKYKTRRKNGFCVRCGAQSLRDSVFCNEHKKA